MKKKHNRPRRTRVAKANAPSGPALLDVLTEPDEVVPSASAPRPISVRRPALSCDRPGPDPEDLAIAIPDDPWPRSALSALSPMPTI